MREYSMWEFQHSIERRRKFQFCINYAFVANKHASYITSFV